jgi:hypothetical protein
LDESLSKAINRLGFHQLGDMTGFAALPAQGLKFFSSGRGSRAKDISWAASSVPEITYLNDPFRGWVFW